MNFSKGQFLKAHVHENFNDKCNKLFSFWPTIFNILLYVAASQNVPGENSAKDPFPEQVQSRSIQQNTRCLLYHFMKQYPS